MPGRVGFAWTKGAQLPLSCKLVHVSGAIGVSQRQVLLCFQCTCQSTVHPILCHFVHVDKMTHEAQT